MVLALLGMGVGVLFGKSPIKGSCGGLNTFSQLGLDCTGCAKPCDSDEKVVCQLSGQHSATPAIRTIVPVSSQR